MKRIAVLMIAAAMMFAGCATTSAPRKSAYVVPLEIKVRPILQYNQTLHDCLEIPYDSAKPNVFVANNKTVNAWVDSDNRLFLTAGLFDHNDDVLAFVMAHELAHVKLGHYGKRVAVSHITTGAMLILNAFLPGAGYLNHVINPAVTNNFSKSQEHDADKLAAYQAEGR